MHNLLSPPPQTASFNLAGKITGTRFARSVASPPPHESVPKGRTPDWVVPDKTSQEQALVYRLSGDYNPLHIGVMLVLPSFLAYLTKHNTQTRA